MASSFSQWLQCKWHFQIHIYHLATLANSNIVVAFIPLQIVYIAYQSVIKFMFHIVDSILILKFGSFWLLINFCYVFCVFRSWKLHGWVKYFFAEPPQSQANFFIFYQKLLQQLNIRNVEFVNKTYREQMCTVNNTVSDGKSPMDTIAYCPILIAFFATNILWKKMSHL